MGPQRLEPWARQVSNLRPLPCEIESGGFSPFRTASTTSQTFAAAGESSELENHRVTPTTPVFTNFTTRRLPEILLTLREVAPRLKVCVATAAKLCAQGKLPSVRVVNSVRVLQSDLEIFIRQRRNRR
jgi:excisionase family DNA binding protein